MQELVQKDKTSQRQKVNMDLVDAKIDLGKNAKVSFIMLHAEARRNLRPRPFEKYFFC